MALEQKIEKFSGVLKSIEINVLKQASFAESLYNEKPLENLEQQKQTSLLERLVGIQSDELKILKESRERAETDERLSDIPTGDRNNDGDRITDVNDDKQDRSSKRGFGLLGGIGLKSILTGIIAGPFLYQFAKGFVDEMFNDVWSNTEESIINGFKDVFAFFRDTDWEAIKNAVIDISQWDFGKLITSIVGLTTAVTLLRAALLIKNLLPGGAAAGAGTGLVLRQALKKIPIIGTGIAAGFGFFDKELEEAGFGGLSRAGLGVVQGLLEVGDLIAGAGAAFSNLVEGTDNYAGTTMAEDFRSWLLSPGKKIPEFDPSTNVPEHLKDKGVGISGVTVSETGAITRNAVSTAVPGNIDRTINTFSDSVNPEKQRTILLNQLDQLDKNVDGKADDPKNQPLFDRLLNRIKSLPVAPNGVEIGIPPFAQKTEALYQGSPVMAATGAPMIMKGGDNYTGGSNYQDNKTIIFIDQSVDPVASLINHPAQSR